MSKILACIVTVALCFTLGYSQQCCEKVEGQCSNIMCNITGQQCPSGNGKAAGLIKMADSGCVVIVCNKTTSFMFSPNTNSSINCCNTTMCNTAAPLANTHTLTLASLASLLLTKALV